jgi:thiamine-phosphate pyrophosphorylase
VTLPRFYPIVDADLARARGWTVPALARACLDGGARLLQIRAKTLGAAELLDVCKRVAADAAPFGASVIVNDRADVARLVGGAGVHVGQDDLPPALARRIVGRDVIVGFSTHDAGQVEGALREPISYLAVGPVFGTRTKETGYDEVGLDLVRRAARASADAVTTRGGPSLPVVAIGGITLDLAMSAIEAGAASVAVISDIFATGDPPARVRAYIERLA